jgi:hypothetical protein
LLKDQFNGGGGFVGFFRFVLSALVVFVYVVFVQIHYGSHDVVQLLELASVSGQVHFRFLVAVQFKQLKVR